MSEQDKLVDVEPSEPVGSEPIGGKVAALEEQAAMQELERKVEESKELTPKGPAFHDPDMQRMLELGNTFAASAYFSDARKASQAMVKVMAGRDLGIGPVASMVGIYLVDGKIQLGANILAALVRRSGRYDYRVTELSDARCEIEFRIREGQGWETLGSSIFTTADTKRAGLENKSTYKSTPRNMLFARAMSNGVKWFTPDVTGGAPMYVEGEIEEAERPSMSAEVTVEVPGPRSLHNGKADLLVRLRGILGRLGLKEEEVAGDRRLEDLSPEELSQSIATLSAVEEQAQ